MLKARRQLAARACLHESMTSQSLQSVHQRSWMTLESNLRALLHAAGKTLRTFAGPVDDYAVGSAAGAGGAVNWPLFKWAGGGEDKCALCWG
jgi:hypothetical protein